MVRDIDFRSDEFTEEEYIKIIMEALHVSEGEARFIYAIETGKITGDVVTVEDTADSATETED